MSDPVLLRRRVRVILSALPPNRRASEQLLFDKLLPDFPELKVAEMSEAISWNHARGFIEYRHNADEERTEWMLTPEGRNKEGLP